MSFPLIVYAVKVFTTGGEGVPAPAGFQGAGDIVGGAVAAWSTRAYTKASIGSNAIRLRRDSDQSESDFTTVTNGGLDLTGITSFKGSANLFVTKMYDQTGNGNDIGQTTAAIQPPFILNGQGTLPVLRFDSSTAQTLITPSTVVIGNQPSTVSTVAKRTANFTTQQDIILIAGGAYLGGWTGVANTVYLYSGGQPTATATDNVYHAMQRIYNGLSSDMNVDGTANTGGGGSNNPGTGTVLWCRPNTFPMDGDHTEYIIWPNLAFSPSQSSSMSANQHSYWGF